GALRARFPLTTRRPPRHRAARVPRARREPAGRRPQRRDRDAPPAAGVPAGPRPRPGRNPGRRPLPGLRVRSSRRRRARRVRRQRRPRRPGPRLPGGPAPHPRPGRPGPAGRALIRGPEVYRRGVFPGAGTCGLGRRPGDRPRPPPGRPSPPRASEPAPGAWSMRIRDILRTKGDTVATVRPEATVRQLLAVLAEHNIGAAVVS